MSEIISKIKSRGYWEVQIKPTSLDPNRIETRGKCKEIIEKLAVKYGGRQYPRCSPGNEARKSAVYIVHAFDSRDTIEFWQYYLTGKFVHYFGMWEDWQDWEATSQGASESPKKLHVCGTVWRLAAIYEFASKLAAKNLLGEECTISVTLHGTKERALWSEFYPSPFPPGTKVSTLDKIPRSLTIATDELFGDFDELAKKHAVFIFGKFNWDIPTNELDICQEE
jgi:hypothetical protein